MAENVGKRGSSWYFRLDLPPGPDGRRHQKRIGGFATAREARNALAKAVVSVSEGKLRYAPAQTFGGLETEWLDVVGPNRKATTLNNYTTLANAYLVPHLGTLRVDRITPTVVQKLYVDLRAGGGQAGRPLSGTHVRNIHRVLHNVLGYAKRMGYLAVNSTDAVERPKDDTAERPIYTPEQVRKFLAAAEDDRLHALWHLEIVTGLRRAELAGLRWQDIELAGTPPTLNVRVARTVAGPHVVEAGPKTRAGRRSIVLDRRTVEVLTEHHEQMESEARLRHEKALPDQVFVDELGAPYHPNRLTRSLHALQQRAKLPEITLHDLRHTSATVALLAGVHPKVVSERHGHASTQITLDRYSHVIESMQVGAAEAIGRFLAPPDA